jgi:hypothetical protein
MLRCLRSACRAEDTVRSTVPSHSLRRVLGPPKVRWKRDRDGIGSMGI